MSNQVGQRAVVLGGSMAGLLAARVLAESYEDVTVIDRDVLSGVVDPRRGAPQGSHAHALLARGQQALDELFPGLSDEMRAAGLPLLDMAEMHWHLRGRRLASVKSGLIAANVARPLLESMVRARVAGLPRVRFIERCDIIGLAVADGGHTVTGARIARHDGSGEEVLPADLVVDATGRGSRTPLWLAELGYERPVEERIKIGLSYTTCMYRFPKHPMADEQSVIGLSTPDSPRGAYFGRCGHDRYVLSLVGMLGDRPAPGVAGYVDFAKSLPFPDLYEAIKDVDPLGDPVTMQFPASVRRRYERLRRFPARLLVVGDAVCSFNPIYGQGMTVSALEALALRGHLRQGTVPDAVRFFKEIAGIVNAPWDISAGGDLAWPQVEAPRPLKVRMGNRYMARLQTAALVDGEITGLFMRVCGLVDPPSTLMRPSMMLRVRRSARRADAMLATTPGPVPAGQPAPRPVPTKTDRAA